MLRTRGEAIRWLCHPLTLLALALLILNDHVFKAAWPGVITGKLSDFAGMFIAPPLAMLLIGLITPKRAAAVSAIIVAIGFTFVKTTAIGAQTASEAWSLVNGPSIIYRDPTDLIALPMLLIALAVWRHARTRPASARLMQITVLPVAVLAVMATSAPRYNTADAIHVTAQHEIIILGDNGTFASYDAGATFRPVDHSAEFSQGRRGMLEECVAGTTRCYRVIYGSLRVEQSEDNGATWTVAWEVSEEVRKKLAKSYRDVGYDFGGKLESKELVVISQPSGHVVIVANGRDGILVRAADGTWTRKGFGAGRLPPSLPDEPAHAGAWWEHVREQPHLGVIALLASAATACGVALHRRGHRRAGLRVGLGVGFGSLLIVCVPGTGFALFSGTVTVSVPPEIFVAYLLINAALLLVPLLTALRRRVLTPGHAAVVVLLSAGTAALIYAPASINADAWPLGTVIFVPCLAGMLWYGHRLGKAQSTA